MKTKGELMAIKKDVETLKEKLTELTEDELKMVSGGDWNYVDIEIALGREND